jgi:argininosuccinate synthase
VQHRRGRPPQHLTLVTFEEGTVAYDHRDAAGFIRLDALPLRTLGQRRKKLGL